MKYKFDFIEITDRAKIAFKINNDNELADAIGMKPPAFNNRKKANSLPYGELLEAANSRNINFNWLLTGEGEMYKHPSGESTLNKRHEMITRLFDALSERQQQEILLAIEEKERLNKLEKQMFEFTRENRLSA